MKTLLAVSLVLCGVLYVAGWRAIGLSAAETGKGQTSGNAAVTTDGSATTSAKEDRLREGTTITEQVGYFKLTGDRLTFYSTDGKQRLGGLENLNLERVVKIVGESPETLEWIVSGSVTEYQGTNYLLISRAVLKTKVNRRGPAVKT